MAVPDDTGRDAAFEERIDGYYTELVFRLVVASGRALPAVDIAALLVIHQGKVVELLERDPRFVAGRLDQYGRTLWSDRLGWKEARARNMARAAGSPFPVRQVGSLVMDANAGRLARYLHRAGRPLSRGTLAEKTGLKQSAVRAVFRSRHARHRRLFVPAGRDSSGAKLFVVAPEVGEALDAGRPLVVDRSAPLT